VRIDRFCSGRERDLLFAAQWPAAIDLSAARAAGRRLSF
jgi:hypothetical protein